MRIITINLPIPFLDAMRDLVELKVLPSRSEGIRQALDDFIRAEANFKEILKNTKSIMRGNLNGQNKV